MEEDLLKKQPVISQVKNQQSNNDAAAEVRALPYYFAKQHGILLEKNNSGAWQGYYRMPLSTQNLCELMSCLPAEASCEGLDEAAFTAALTRTYEHADNAAQQALDGINDHMDLTELMHAIPTSEDLLAKQDDAPVIALINALLAQAIARNASDMHFEVFEKHLSVRLRVDGVLHEVLRPERVIAALIISRLKVMAQLDIAEKRLPQDGRIALSIAGRQVDVRVSTIPAHYGERVVLRLLDKKSVPLDLSKLGMSDQHVVLLRDIIHKPHGIILVTGPTGSGKTTTLYSALTELNETQRNIMTVEDPVEYYLPGVSQTQVNRKINMDFACGLRAILRQDPDIVMVGEIRDKETAEMAIQASLTGHLVLSTLHTNSALGSIARLRDMGMEPFLLASTLLAVAAQRLLRKLCEHCKKPYAATDLERQRLAVADSEACTLYQAQGCEQCHDTGFRGRLGVYEIVEVDDALKQCIHQQQDEPTMRQQLGGRYHSMQQDAMRLVLAGQTSMTEAMRLCLGDADASI